MKDLEELLPRVTEVCPACPEPTIIRHLRDAAIEFCRRTRVWRDHDEFELGPEKCEAVACETDAQVFEITHAAITIKDDSTDEVLQRTDLEAKTVDWLDKNEPNWRAEEGTPRYVTQFSPNTVRVTPIPEEGATLRLELILLPAIDTERVPDVLIDTYSQVIADGALARILALPTTYMQPELAAVHARVFDNAVNHWADRIPRGQQRTRRKTKPSSFF